MNHLRVLGDAGLVTSRKEGRTRRLYMNAMPLQMIYERWIDGYSAHWLDRMSLIKQAAEMAAQKTGNTQ